MELLLLFPYSSTIQELDTLDCELGLDLDWTDSSHLIPSAIYIAPVHVYRIPLLSFSLPRPCRSST